VDVIVVYKVDRLTRSLADFAKLVGLRGGSGPEAAVEPASVVKDRWRASSRSSVRSGGEASQSVEGRP
jgi:hypothetical protein